MKKIKLAFELMGPFEACSILLHFWNMINAIVRFAFHYNDIFASTRTKTIDLMFISGSLACIIIIIDNKIRKAENHFK